MDVSKLRFPPFADDAVCSCQEKPEISSSNSRSGYLSITVSDSRIGQELNSRKTYYSYLVTTTDNGELRSESAVRRRFSDFQTLMDRLFESYPDIGGITYFIAQFAKSNFAKSNFAKSKHVGFKKTEEQRMVALEKCLWMLASHPITRKSEELREFLQVNPKILEEHDEFLKKNKKSKKTEHHPINVSQKVESLQAIGGTLGKEWESPFGTRAQFEQALHEAQRLRLADDLIKKAAAAKKPSRVYKEWNEQTYKALEELTNDSRAKMPIIVNPFPDPTRSPSYYFKLVEDLKIPPPKTSDGRDVWACKFKELTDAIKDSAYKEYEKFKEIYKSELESIDKKIRGLTIS